MNNQKISTSGKRFFNISLPLLFAFVSLGLVPGSLFAQPNFSGSWAFNESKSILGDGPMMSATSMTVDQQEGLISMDLVRPSVDGGDMKTTEKYTLDGKESVNTGMMDSSIKTITTWSDDKKELKFAKTILFDMNGDTMEIKISEIWSMSEDGKTLTVKSTMSSQMGESTVTLAYDKK